MRRPFLPNFVYSAGPHSPRSWFHVRILVTLASLLALTNAGTLFARALDPNQCYRVGLSQPIQWATSGAWVHSAQSEILRVVDSARQDILFISLTGQVRSGTSIAELKSVAPQPVNPRRLTMRGGQYWLLDTSASFLRSDNSLESWGSEITFGQRPIEKTGRFDDWQLKAVYQFAPMASGILAFGDINNGSEWKSAFLYYDVEDSGTDRWKVYRSMGTKETIRNSYARDLLPYLAGMDEFGYLLFLDPKPVIVEVRPDSAEYRELSSFPEDFQSWPDLDINDKWKAIMKLASLTPRVGPRKERIFYEIVEDEPATPAGLYAWRDFLYLLGRRKAETAGTAEWWLIKLDPRDGTELFRFPLPTSAAHLTVVPGGDYWAFIEKQAVVPVGEMEASYMRTNSMALVPSTWIEDSSSARSTTCLTPSH